MARTVGSSGLKTSEAIRAAGLRLIHRHGYAAMSLRDLAAEVGIQAGSLYNYIESKQELLFGLVEEHMTELLVRLDEALDGIEEPKDRLIAFSSFHLRYHMAHQAETFVVNSELRSLEPNNHAKIVSMRRAYEARLEEILAEGARADLFDVADVRVTAFAILGLLTGVCGWYRPGGRLSEDEIVAIHIGLLVGE